MQDIERRGVVEEEGLVRKLAGLDRSVRVAYSDLGWTSRVYIVGCGEIVFKFPRFAEIRKEYTREIAAYEVARDVGGVLVPEVKWRHADNDYLGYKGIVGETLDKAIPRLTPAERRATGARLGAFLKKFHRRSCASAPVRSPEEEFAERAQRFERGLPVLERHFSAEEIDRIRHLILAEYPRTMGALGFTPGLCHGDLGYWNIIFCANGDLGLIDFGDIAYCDTSHDFAGMDDPDLLAGALDAYDGDVSREKISLRMMVLPILELPFFAERGEHAEIENAVARIRRTVLKR